MPYSGRRWWNIVPPWHLYCAQRDFPPFTIPHLRRIPESETGNLIALPPRPQSAPVVLVTHTRCDSIGRPLLYLAPTGSPPSRIDNPVVCAYLLALARVSRGRWAVAEPRTKDSLMANNPHRQLLRHYLASIAYHAQKAIRGAPPSYWAFSPGNQVRTPETILRHMTSVLGYARTFFVGGIYRPESLPAIQAEIDQFHQILEDVSQLLDTSSPLQSITELQLLQGPFSDVMTHIGQLSLLRRLYGSPVPPENFIYAEMSATRLGKDQQEPLRPDSDWPERPTA
jgi:hypothetical protein